MHNSISKIIPNSLFFLMNLLLFHPAFASSWIKVWPQKKRKRKIPQAWHQPFLALQALMLSCPLRKWPTAESAGWSGSLPALCQDHLSWPCLWWTWAQEGWPASWAPLSDSSLLYTPVNLFTFSSHDEGAAFKMLTMIRREAGDNHLVKWHNTGSILFYIST